jgi:thiol-disulfide isomerase/thioredoxin
MQPSRRLVLASAAGFAASFRSALADAPAAPLFASSGLAANPVAQIFNRLPAPIPLPRVALTGPSGETVSSATGRGAPRIINLWAEWCSPCLIEAPDFARFGRRYGGRKLGVSAILTNSRRRLDPTGAKILLSKLDALDLPFLIEPNGGAVLYSAFADPKRGLGGMPCTLLVDRDGKVRGRSFGLAPADPAAFGQRLKRLAEAHNGNLSADDMNALWSGTRTIWASPAADAFVKALEAGALDHV